MSTAHKKCGSQNWAVLVFYSYCYSKPVLVHATDQDCKDTGGVVRGILDESSYASTPKFFNALKTSMVRICALAVAKPVDQGSPISSHIAERVQQSNSSKCCFQQLDKGLPR